MPNPLIDAVIARDGKDAYNEGLKQIQDNKAKKVSEAKEQAEIKHPAGLPHSTLNDAPASVRKSLEGKPLSLQQPSSQYGQPAIPKAPSAPSVQPFGGGAFNADDALANKDPYRMMTDKGQPIAQPNTKKEWKDSGVVQPYEVNPYKGKAVLPYSTKDLRDTYVTLQNDGRFLLDIRGSKIKGANGSRDFSVENFKEVPQSKSQIDNYRILDSEGLSQSRKAMGKFYNVPASKLYGTPEAKAELDRRNAQIVAVKIIGLSNGDLSYKDFQALRRDILNGRGNVYSYNVADFIASKREQKGNILADHKAQGNAMLSNMKRLQSDREKATGKKDYYYPTNTPVPVGSMSTSDLADAHELVSMRMNRSLDMLDIVEKKARGKNGWFSNFGEGVGEGLANELVSSVSLGQGRGSDYLQKLIKRYNKGEKLNKEDSALLDAFAYSNTIDSEMVRHIPASYKIGETTGASIPFMIDFLAANAVAGVGEIGAKVGGKITQKALQAMIRNGLIDNSRGLTRFGAKLLGGVARVATDAGVAGVMTAANPRQMGKIASNATEMLEEKPLASTSSSGAPKFGGVTLAPQETSEAKAFAKSFTDQWIENWSEMAGGWLGGIGKGSRNFGKAIVGGAFNDVKKSVPQMMANYGSSSIGGALTQGYKAAVNIGKKAGFNGVVEENLEEYVGNAARVMILGGDHTWDREFSPEQIKETFVGLLPTMLMFGAIGGVSTAGQHATSARQLKEYEDKLKARGIDTDKAREQMSNMSFNEYVQHEAALLTKARIKHAEAEVLLEHKDAGANKAMEAAKEAEEKAMFALHFAQYQGVRGVDAEAIQEAREAHEREVDRSIDNSVKSVSHLLSQENNPDNTPNPTAGTYSRVERNGKEYVVRNGKFKAVAQRYMESGAPIKDRNGNVSYEVDADELLYLQDANGNVVPVYSSDVTPLGETIRLDGLKNSAKSILMSDASGGIQPSAIIDESTLRELSDPNNNLPYVQAEPSAFVSSEEVEQVQSDIAGMEPQGEQQEQVPQGVPQTDIGVDHSEETPIEEESFVLNDDEEKEQGEWDNLDDFDPNRPIEVGDDVLFDSDGRGYVKTGVVSQVSDDAYYIQAQDGGMHVIPFEQGIWHNMFNRKGWAQQENNTQEQGDGVVDTTSPEEATPEEQQEADPQTVEEWVAYFDGDIEAAINWIENTIHVLKKDLSKLKKESKQINSGETPSEYKARMQESRVVIDAIGAKIEENEGILSDLHSMLAGEEVDESQEETNESEEVNEVEEENVAPIEESEEEEENPSEETHIEEENAHEENESEEAAPSTPKDDSVEEEDPSTQPYEEEELEPEKEVETTETTTSPTESEEKSQKEGAESEKTEGGQESETSNEEGSNPELESKTASEVLDEVVAENVKRPKKKSKKQGSKKEFDSSVWAFTTEDPTRPVLAGVYHDGGYAVATNMYVLIAEKAAYDPSKEGSIVDRKGNVIDAKFPGWRAVIPENLDSFNMDFWILIDKLREVRSKIEKEILADRGLSRISPKIKNEASGSVISVRFPNGVDLQFELGYMESFANAAVRLGITEMGMEKGQDCYRIFAQNKNGILGCVTIHLGRNTPSIESIDLENVAQEENNIERENLKEAEKGALYHRSSPDGMVSSNDAKQRTIEHLVERLKKSGLAEDVIVDKEAFKKKLEEVDNVQFLKDGEQVYGFVSNGVVYLNPDLLNTNTPIHEFAHLWNSLIKQKEPELWNEGVGLVKDSSYMDEVRKNPYYSQLSEEDQLDEAMAMAIGDFGAKEIESKGIRGASLRAWIGKVWDRIRSFLGIPKREYKNLDDFARTALNDLLGGVNVAGGVNQGRLDFQTTKAGLTPEMEEIKNNAIEDGSYMKAHNGADTNLTERQWLQVRTKAFKNWFGDWEKKARIEKLRKSSPIVLQGNEYEGKYELNRDSAKKWIKGNLRGKYVVGDTQEEVEVSRVGANKVTSHSMGNKAHLQSIVAIPDLIENAIFIEEVVNEKDTDKYDSYRYYVVGLQIGGVDYTVKLTIGVKQGKKYYDHALTEIEKGKLIDELARNPKSFTTTGDAPVQSSALSVGKDKRLLSLLQVGEVSKVVDENGEPLVVDDLFLNTQINVLSYLNKKLKRAQKWVDAIKNAEKKYGLKEGAFEDATEEFVYATYEDDELKYYWNEDSEIHFLVSDLYNGRNPKVAIAFRYGDVPDEGVSRNHRDDFRELGVSMVGRVSELNTTKNWWYDSLYGEEDYAVFAGFDTGHHGSDGEMLLLGVKKLGAYKDIGDLVKSATDNVGSFDGDVEDIRFRRSETPLRESDGDIFVRGQINPNLPENFQSYHFFYEPGLDYIYADPTEYYRLESVYNENGGHLPEGWEYDFNPDDFKLKEGYVCCHLSDEYEYPSIQSGAGDDSYCVFFEGDEVAEVYDGVVAHIIRPLDSWERQKDGTYKRIISDDNTRYRNDERTPEQIVSENDSAYDTLYDRAGVEKKAKSVVDKLSVPIDVKVKSKHEVPRSARNTKGYYDPKSGEVVVVLENVSSREDLEKTILHEVIGHKGLDALIPEADRDAFFNGVYNLLSEEQLLPIMARYPNAGKRELAEEFIAHLAEGYVHPTLITRVSKAIRSLLRSLGFNLRLTDGEVMTLLYRGSVALKRESATAAQEIAYINQDKAVSESMSYMDELNAMSLDELRDEVGENGVKLAQRMRLLESLGESERLRYRADEAFKEIEVENVDRSAVADSMNEAFTGKKVGEHKIPTWTQFLEETQDDLISLRKYQENVEKSTGKKLPSYLNIDKVFNQMSSRAAAAEELLVDIFEKEVGGVIRKLEKEKKMSYRDIQLYVMAKHAIERNQVKRQKEIEKLSNPTSGDIARIMQQDFSSELDIQYGIEKHLKGSKNPIFSNVDGIRSYIEAIENSAGKDIDALWSSINKLNGEALKMWYEAGMISKDHYNNIKKLYKYYVPLQGIDDETIEDVWTYYGVSNRGNYSLVKDAEGRNKLPDNPFMIMRKSISNTAYMAEHNKAKIVVLALAQTHPTDYLIVRNSWDVLTTDAKGRESWKEEMPESEDGVVTEESMIAFEEKMQALAEEGKAKRHEHTPISNIGGYRVSNPNTLEEHLIRVSVNGKEQIVFVNGSPSFAQAVNRENRGKEREFLSKVAMVTRLKAAFATSLSIPFAFTNGVRDLLWSLSSSGIRYGKDYEMRFVRYYGRAGKFLFSPEDKQDEGMKHLWDEFKRNGGRTGYASMVGDENARKLAQKGLSRGIGKRGVAVRVVNKAGNAISYLGETIEDLTRFAAYCAAREGGKSVTDSIDVAKEMTVNFNRRGKGSSLFMRSIFSFYMFINANIQGMAQLVKMFKNHPVGTSVMAGAYAMLPMFSAILTKLIGDDDDYFALSDYERTHNLIICLGSGKFIKVPMPQEMYPFLAIGNSISELAFGESSVTDALLGSVDGILDGATFGLDASSSSLKHFKRAVSKGEENPTYLLFRGFVPSILQPATDVWNNWDYVGRHIEKPSHGKNTPKYQRVYENKAWGWLVGLSKAINGDDIKGRAMQDDGIIGAINSPANAQYLIESWLGGVVSTIAKDVRFAEDLFRGENFFESASHAAVLGRFIHFDSHLQEKKMQSDFYKAKEGVDIAMKKIKEIQKGIKANEEAISIYEEEGNYVMVGILEKEIEDAEADIMEITNGKDPELYKDASDMFKDYSKEQRQLRELLNSTTDEELRSEIQEQIYNSNEEIMGYYNELLSD